MPDAAAILKRADVALKYVSQPTMKKPVVRRRIVTRKTLSASDPIKVWIDDFINSNNPRFKGKTKDERRRMAIAAYTSRTKAVATLGVFKRADAALAKVFDPNERRVGSGSSHGGEWTSGGGGNSEGGGGYPHGTEPKNKKWRDLTENEKRGRVGEIIADLDKQSQNRHDPISRVRADAKLKELLAAGVDASQAGTARLFQLAANIHSERLNNIQQRRDTADQERLAADTEAQEFRSSTGNNNVPLRISNIEQMGAGWKKTIAEVSSKVASAARTIKTIVDTINQLRGADSPVLLQHSSKILGAVTTASAGLNVASRAQDANTAATAIRGVNGAIKTMRSELPDIWEAAKESKAAGSEKLGAYVTSATNRLHDIETKLNATASIQAAHRARFAATGGKITTRPTAAPRLSVYTPSAPRTSHVAVHVKSPTTNYTPPSFRPRSGTTTSTVDLKAELERRWAAARGI